MKTALLWDIAPCRYIEIDRGLEVLAACIIRAMTPDDGASKHLRNIDEFLPKFSAKLLRTQSYSALYFFSDS
jgi:hypothetical protein